MAECLEESKGGGLRKLFHKFADSDGHISSSRMSELLTSVDKTLIPKLDAALKRVTDKDSYGRVKLTQLVKALDSLRPGSGEPEVRDPKGVHGRGNRARLKEEERLKAREHRGNKTEEDESASEKAGKNPETSKSDDADPVVADRRSKKVETMDDNESTRTRLKELFDSYDEKQEGRIKFTYLRNMIKDCSLPVCTTTIEFVLTKLNIDVTVCDTISFDEFYKVYLELGSDEVREYEANVIIVPAHCDGGVVNRQDYIIEKKLAREEARKLRALQKKQKSDDFPK